MSKISQYTALSTPPRSDDLFPIVDVHDTTMASSGTTKNITTAEMLSAAAQSPYAVDWYGADPSGSADSTAAFVAAVAAMPTTTVNNGTTSHSYPVGTLLLGTGTYKLGSSSDVGNLGPFVSVVGPGSSACHLNYYGAGGDTLRAYNAINPSDNTFDTMFSQSVPYGIGTRYDGFTVDGTNATGISTGIHIGDFEGGVLGPDLHIQNFSTGGLGAPSGLSASAVGSGGSFAAATYYWKITGTTRTGETLLSGETSAAIVLNGSATLTWTTLTGATGYNIYRGTSTGNENTLVAQVGAVTTYTDTGSSVGTGAPAPANSSGSVGLFMDNQNAWTENFWGRVSLYNNATAVTMFGCDSTTGGKSFEYNDLTFKIYAMTGQNGVVIHGGGQYGNGSLKIRANTLLSGSAQNCGLLVVTGQAQAGNGAAGQYSVIQFCRLDVQAEANTSGAYSPATVLFGSSSSSRNKIQGCSGVMRFSNFTVFTNWNSASFNYRGVVSGDATLAGFTLLSDYLGVFGDASDGLVTLDGTATFGWASKASSVYTLTRDVYASSFTVNSGVTLNMAGWRVFCQGTVTVSAGGTIQNNGANASGATGGAGGTNGTIAGTLSGANGGTGAGAQGTAFAGPGVGTSGGGGTGSSGAGGSSRSQSGDISSLRSPGSALSGAFGWANTARALSGAGGAGSGAGDGTNSGGGGGAGGGVVVIFAMALINNGAINANGGNGATPSTGNCGGGGAGGGGIIVIYTLSAVTGSGTTSVSAGTPGSGVGTGAAGSAGTAGTYLNEVLA